MRIAILGDIHSNKEAFKTVLLDLHQRQVDVIISTGDLVGYLMYPNEVIDMMKAHNILSIKGNHDEKIAKEANVSVQELQEMSEEEIQKGASRAFTSCVISDINRAYLDTLPTELKMDICGHTVRIVHGSPSGISDYMRQGDLEKYIEELNADIIVSGHTHVPYFTQIEDKYFVNAGSVGIPKHGKPMATYIILDIQKAQVDCEIIEVTYDYEKVIQEVENSSFISNHLVDVLRNGKV